MEWVAGGACLLIGGAVAWILASARGRAAAAAAEARATEQQRAFEAAERRLVDSFKALAADALRSNTGEFLALAQERLGAIQKEAEKNFAVSAKDLKGLVEPVQKTMDRLHENLKEIEGRSTQAYSSLTQEVQKLKSETGSLVTALSKPNVRGQWGEIHLERVVEIAGMRDHCDFLEQVTGSDGSRPDLVVKLPGGKNIVVDAKTPMDAYLQALRHPAGDERSAKLKEHAQQVRIRMSLLGQKSYFSQFTPTPEFVILFIPGEAFVDAALDQDPALLEEGFNKNVLIASPTTLIALLKAAYYGWKQEMIAENVQRISELGRQLHERLAVMIGHFHGLGRSLEGSIADFNKVVGSYEHQVLPQLRKFRELGVTGQKEIKEILKIEDRARSVESASER